MIGVPPPRLVAAEVRAIHQPHVGGTPLERNLNDSAALRGLAAQWAALVRQLEVAPLAHGDLQHGNILVTPEGALCLLDYDGVWTPTLAGLAPGELGHPSYQRPGRTYSRAMDRFSALVIYTALQALVLAPSCRHDCTSRARAHADRPGPAGPFDLITGR